MIQNGKEIISKYVMGISDKFRREIILLVTLIIGYNGLYGLLFLFWVLPPEVYRSPSIVVAGLQSTPFALLLIVPTIVLILSRNELRWNSFEHGHKLRLFVLAIGFSLLWTHVAYDYNFYLDQAHHLDRLILIAIYSLIWVHPLFTYLFIVILMAVMGQFVHPFGSLSITDRILPINILILFSAFLFLQIRFLNPVQRLLDRLGLSTLSQSDDFRSKIFVWVGAGLIGGSYFIPAINKMLILWPFREQLQYYIPSKYLWGWLTFLDTETMLDLYSVMQVLNPIGVFSTIVIEAAAVFLMWRRNISIVIISSFVFLHTAIFVLSGIAFWKWIIVDIAFLLFIVLVDKSDQSNVFEQKTVIVVTLLIIFSPIIIQTAPLGWYTNNYDARYTIETVSESGEIQDVHWSEMDPYVYTFSSGRFEYIYNGQSISGVAQNWTMTNELRSSTSKEDVRSFKETYGENQYNQQNAQMFDCFMHQYFNTRLERQGNEVIWDKIPSVPHFWSTKSTRPLSSGKNITHVQIRRTEYIYTDKQIITVSSEVIREVNLTQPMSQCQLGDGL